MGGDVADDRRGNGAPEQLAAAVLSRVKLDREPGFVHGVPDLAEANGRTRYAEK